MLIIAPKRLRGSSMASRSDTTFARGPEAGLAAAEHGDLRHPVFAQDARGYRMTFGVVGVEQAVGRNALDYLRQLPPEIDRVSCTPVLRPCPPTE